MTNQADRLTLAMDRSARTYDEDGRLRVALTAISKAAVNPYYGREIPDYRRLGLTADTVYYLLRDPAELERGASTFCGVQLLDKHIPVNAANPQDDQIVGAIGTDAAFVDPYLRASLIVWDAEAIKRIESGEQRQLSSAYRYDPDMTPGDFEGAHYDGVMRNIRGNHVALVEAGRAGPDVMVGDAALAADPDDVPASTTQPTKETIMAASRKARVDARLEALKPYLAQDADITKLRLALDAKEDDDKPAEDEDDETEAEKKAREAKEADAKKAAADEDDDKKDDEKDKAAMDAAIAAAVTKARAETETAVVSRMNALTEAQRAVRPHVGDVFGMDSADAVYAFALKQLGVSTKDVHPSAYPAMLKMVPAPGSTPRVAMDSAAIKGFAERFPSTSRIRSA